MLRPALPGERGGKVVIELRLGGGMAIRFRGQYLKYQEAVTAGASGGAAPQPPGV